MNPKNGYPSKTEIALGLFFAGMMMALVVCAILMLNSCHGKVQVTWVGL